MKRQTALIFALFFCLFTGKSQNLYWTSPSNERIYKADGDNIGTISNALSGLNLITADFSSDIMYFSLSTGIYTFNLNTDAILSLKPVFSPNDMEFNPVNNKLYWTESSVPGVWSCESDGDNLNELTIGNSDLEGTNAIAVDYINGKVYFSDTLDSKIYKIDLDGNNFVQLLSFQKATAMTVNVLNNKLYWINYFDKKVWVSDTDGKNASALTSAINEPGDISIDYDNEKIVYSDIGINNTSIMQMNFDGSSNEDLLPIYKARSIVIESESLSIEPGPVYGAPFNLAASDNVTFDLSYTISGIFKTDNIFKAELSNKSGDFTNPTVVGQLQSQNSGAIHITLPLDLQEGSNYKIRIVSTEPNYIGETTEAFEINENTAPFFLSQPNTEVPMNSFYVYNVEYTDLNGDDLTVSTPDLPSWLKYTEKDTLYLKTVTGTNSSGNTDGTLVQARFFKPTDIAIDNEGNVFIVDQSNHCIRKIDENGIVSTFAGSGNAGFTDGQGTSAEFNVPSGIDIDGNGNLFVADKNNHCIRKISPEGMVSVYAGTNTIGYINATGILARFKSPTDVTIDRFGNVYVADLYNHVIRKIDTYKNVTTLAGKGTSGFTDGQPSIAQFNKPFSVVADEAGNIFVSDQGNSSIRKIANNGLVSTIAGNGSSGFADGNSTSARFSMPAQLAIDLKGVIYVADYGNHCIRKITDETLVETLIGGVQGFEDGSLSAAKFNYPEGISVGAAQNIFIADSYNHSIRKIYLKSNLLSGTPGKIDIGINPVRFVLSDGETSTEQQFNITVNALAPTTQASSIEFRNIQATSMRVAWTNGNGTGRIVVAKIGGPVDFIPVDYIDISGISADIEAATDQGNGNMVVYKGSSNFFDLTNLTEGDNLYFAIFEFNGEGNYIKYLQENPATALQATNQIVFPDISGSPFNINSIQPLTFKIPFQASGSFTDQNFFQAYISDKFGDFDNEIKVAGIQSKVSDTLVIQVPIGTPIGSNYKIRIKSTDPAIVSEASNSIEFKSKLEVELKTDKLLTNAPLILSEITFSDLVENFSITKLNITNGKLQNLTEVQLDRKWTVEIVPQTEYGYINISIPENAVKNESGQGNIASGYLSILYDSKRPEATLTSTEQPHTNSDEFQIQVSFSEDVSTVTDETFEVTNCIIKDILLFKPSTSWIATVVPTDTILSVRVPANSVSDKAGNKNHDSNILTFSFDDKAPVATFECPYSKFTKNTQLPITLKFNEKVSGVNALDFKNSLNANVLSITEQKDSLEWLIWFESIEGNVEIEFSKFGVRDIAGNYNQTETKFQIYCDLTAPKPVFSTDVGLTTNLDNVNVKIQFNDNVMNFEQGDITIVNALVNKFEKVHENDIWNLNVSPIDTGDVRLSISSELLTDSAKNLNIASDIFIFNYDNKAPVPKINSLFGDTVNKQLIEFNIEFTEKVIDFKQENLHVINGSVNYFVEDSIGFIYKVEIIPDRVGIIYFDILKGAVKDAAGNENAELNYKFVYDDVSPNVTLSSTVPELTNETSIPVKIVFDEYIKGFTIDDIFVENGKAKNLEAIVPQKLYNVTISTGDVGFCKVYIPRHICTDLAGNTNTESDTLQFIFDNSLPEVRLTYNGTGSDVTRFGINLTFSKAVRNFTINDVKVLNVKNVFSLQQLSDSLYYFEFVPYVNDTVRVSLPSNRVFDFAGNGNIASELLSIAFENDVKAPEIEIITPGDTVYSDFIVRFISQDAIVEFSQEKLYIENGTIHDVKRIDAKTYEASIVPLSEGEITITINRGTFKDFAYFENVKQQTSVTFIQKEEAFGLDVRTFEENVPANTAIAKFEMYYPYNVGNYIYKIAPGNGLNDQDNTKFTIVGDSLITLEQFNFENQSTYFVHVRAYGSYTPSTNLIIKITDVNEAPVFLKPFEDVVYSYGDQLQVNLPIYNVIDEDKGDKNELFFFKSLASGEDLPSWLKIDDNLTIYSLGKIPEKNDTLRIKLTVMDLSQHVSSTEFNFIIIDATDGIQPNTLNKPKIYPNPVKTDLNISLGTAPLTSNEFLLYDSQGKLLYSEYGNGQSYTFHMDSFPQGIYFLEIKNQYGSIIQKITKQ